MLASLRKPSTEIPNDIFRDIELSDEMIRRDNYFHSCWMNLKHTRPDRNEAMTEVELDIAGYTKEEGKEDNDSDTDDMRVL